MTQQTIEQHTKTNFNKMMQWIPSFFYGGLMIYQLVLSVIYYKSVFSNIIQYIGWGLLFSTAIFGQLPVRTFRKYGKVKDDKSYIHTSKLVDKGLYSVMRHPQYFSWILITFGLTCLNQLWYSLLISVIISPVIYYDMIREERSSIIKFGNEYQEYMKRVPRINFILGIYRKIRNHSHSK